MKRNNSIEKGVAFLFLRTDLANHPLQTNRVGTMTLKRNIFDNGLSMVHCDIKNSEDIISIDIHNKDNHELSRYARDLNNMDFIIMIPTSRYDRFLTTYQPFKILEHNIYVNTSEHTLTITVDMSHSKKKYKIYNKSHIDFVRIAVKQY